MSGEPTTMDRAVISAAAVREAVNAVVWSSPTTVEPAEPVCEWPRLCGEQGCRFPRYQRGGAAQGLVARTLLGLGYPPGLLKELDDEYEVGEVLHPGVKIHHSRKAALGRIDENGMALLRFVQEHQKLGITWFQISTAAFARRAMRLRRYDMKRRPWLY